MGENELRIYENKRRIHALLMRAEGLVLRDMKRYQESVDAFQVAVQAGSWASDEDSLLGRMDHIINLAECVCPPVAKTNLMFKSLFHFCMLPISIL